MTDTLTKALSILTAQAANPVALEALVEAMQACLEGEQYDGSGDSLKAAVEAEIKPKHVLEDYKITEKDVGSLVWYNSHSDFGDFSNFDILNACHSKDSYKHWEPVLDTFKLFFKPYYATPDSVAPDDLGEHFAVLWNDGEITIYNRDSNGLHINSWKRFEGEDDYMIGYRPLQFVNPLKQDK